MAPRGKDAPLRGVPLVSLMEQRNMSILAAMRGAPNESLMEEFVSHKEVTTKPCREEFV